MTAARRDLERELRQLHTARSTPALVDVPELPFLLVDGHGDPNTSAAYGDAVAALYAVSYKAKFALKRAGVLDYGVMPLEGLWWVPDMSAFSVEDKAAWDWTMLILQPAELSEDFFAQARAQAGRKPLPALERLRLERFREGRAAQVLHLCPCAAEGPTVAGLHAFIGEQGLDLAGKHHEIYVGDPRRSAPERLKTIIRQPVD